MRSAFADTSGFHAQLDGTLVQMPWPNPRSVASLLLALLAGVACERDQGDDVTMPAGGWGRRTLLRNAEAPLSIPTYDGSGQGVHPDVLCFPEGWRGFRYWMAMTPYPFSNDEYENPSILVSQDGRTWNAPPRAPTPLDPAARDHNCDPELTYVPERDEVQVAYVDAGSGTSYLNILRSADGAGWKRARSAIPMPDYVVSPAVLRGDDSYLMWAVDAGPSGFASQSSRIVRLESANPASWDYKSAVEVDLPMDGLVPWHVDVVRIAGHRAPRAGYLMLLCAYPLGSTADEATLWAAFSEDSLSFRLSGSAILQPGRAGAWDDLRIYRSTGVYHPETGRLEVWYSAENAASGAWHIGYAATDAEALFRRCEALAEPPCGSRGRSPSMGFRARLPHRWRASVLASRLLQGVLQEPSGDRHRRVNLAQNYGGVRVLNPPAD